jgi:predicted MFS family arabinose efflux permease
MKPVSPKHPPTPAAPERSSSAAPDAGSATSPSATFALILAPFVAVLSLMALGPFLPSMAADLNTSVGLLGQIPALMNLVAALMAIIVGPVADQYGFRRFSCSASAPWRSTSPV